MAGPEQEQGADDKRSDTKRKGPHGKLPQRRAISARRQPKHTPGPEQWMNEQDAVEKQAERRRQGRTKKGGGRQAETR